MKVPEKQSVSDWAISALKLIEQQGLQPYPQVYALFFEYVRGTNKKLIAEILKQMQDKTGFNEKTIETLHAKHITNDFDKRILEESGHRVQVIMSDVLRAIDFSAGDTKQFNTELDSFTVELTENKDEDIGYDKLVTKLIAKTNEFKGKSEKLQQKLEASKAEVDLLKITLQEASTQMMVDALTGVANRKAFDENIARLINESKTDSRQLCMLMIDIDHFKKFNDTYGHLIGDQVIKIVAAAMKDMVKGKDFVARYGGEEFAVLLPDTPLKGGQIVADSIRSNIASRELKRKDTGESYGQITVSIGVSMLRPRHDKLEDFIARADKALYTAKKNGRNKVVTEE